MDDKMSKIRAVEEKYNHVVFGMGLTHLMDVGHRNFDAAAVDDSVKRIHTKGAEAEANGTRSIMSPAFQCEIIRCAGALAAFSPWTLFVYIKKHMEIGGA